MHRPNSNSIPEEAHNLMRSMSTQWDRNRYNFTFILGRDPLLPTCVYGLLVLVDRESYTNTHVLKLLRLSYRESSISRKYMSTGHLLTVKMSCIHSFQRENTVKFCESTSGKLVYYFIDALM